MGARGKGWRGYALQVVERGREVDAPCCRCGQPIDYSLPGRHPDGPTADHLAPVMHGGAPQPALESMGVAHSRCNSRHGAHIRNRKGR